MSDIREQPFDRIRIARSKSGRNVTAFFSMDGHEVAQFNIGPGEEMVVNGTSGTLRIKTVHPSGMNKEATP